jgi:hypothetical protein
MSTYALPQGIKIREAMNITAAARNASVLSRSTSLSHSGMHALAMFADTFLSSALDLLNSTALFEDRQASPACPSNNSIMKMTNMEY